MDLNYKQEITVGTLVVLAVVAFLVGTTWLDGRSVGADGEYWQIQFADIGNLKPSSPVKVSGVTVGQVEQVNLQGFGRVIVGISLDEQIVPKVDATAEVVAVGFVGDAAIHLNPGRAAQPLPKDRIILGSAAEGLAGRAEQLGDRADSVLVGAQAIVNQRTADELYETLNALQATMQAAQRTMESARQTMQVYGDPRRGPTAELTRTMVGLQRLSARLDSTLANPALARTITRADTLTGNLAAMTAQLTSTGERLDSLLTAVNRGDGTLGKFVTDSGLYYDMRSTSQSLKQLIDALQKNPGQIGVTVKLF